MSGFNPFPEPFSDPSIAQETQNNQNNQSSLIDDFNPFANQKSREPATLPTNTSTTINSSAPIVTTQQDQQPPVYSQSAIQNITQNELQKRQEELERKAAELAAKEEALRNLEGTVKPPNWPPIPSFCPVGPCFYQDINVEIQPEFQRIVRYAYYLWMCFVLVLFINMLGNLVLVINADDYLSGFLSSIVSIFIFTPVAFLCWFRPLYKAFKNDSSINFMIFFFVFFCQLVVSICWAIGLTSGSCGLLTLTKNLDKGAFVTFFLVFVCFALLLYAFASFLMLIQVHSIYRHTGASMEKAQAEFTQNVLSSQAAQNATQQAASSYMSNMFNRNQSNTDPRY